MSHFRCGYCHPKDQKHEISCEKCTKTQCGTCKEKDDTECNPDTALVLTSQVADLEYGLSSIDLKLRCPDSNCFQESPISCGLVDSNNEMVSVFPNYWARLWTNKQNLVS